MLKHLLHKVSSRKSIGKLRSIDINSIITNDINKKIDFSSNDYLGLSRSHKLVNNIDLEYSKYIKSCVHNQPLLGSTGSRLLTG